MFRDLSDHLPVMRRYAQVLTRNPDAAEELVQEALVRALEGARTWKVGGDLRKWLLAIVHNSFVSRRRRERTEAASLEALEDVAAPVPVDQSDRVHLGQTIEALMALPVEQREALVLVAIEGMSYRSAAEILGIPLGTLMSRLARARETLRVETGRADGEENRPRLRLVR